MKIIIGLIAFVAWLAYVGSYCAVAMNRKGVKLSDETKLKMSLAKKNKQISAGIKCETLSAYHK